MYEDYINGPEDEDKDHDDERPEGPSSIESEEIYDPRPGFEAND